MKVQHKKTGRTAEVLSQDDKQVRIKFDENGQEQGMMISTYKRWWKVIDDNSVENPMTEHIESVEVKEVKPVDDNKCGDGTQLAEVGKEILEQAKQKAKEIKKKPKTTPKISVKVEDRVNVLTEYLNANKIGFRRSGKVLKVFKNNGRQLHIYVGKDNFTVNITEKNAPKDKIPDRKRNCPLSCVFVLSYDNIKEIKDFM